MAILNSHEPDECCGKALSKALLSGSLDTANSWECPKCGQEWRPKLTKFIPGDGALTLAPDPIRHWTPHVYMEVVPLAL
jgi:hypothetical protein